MGYTIGSGKDSRQDAGFTEQEVLARFVENQQAITAYSKANKIPLEDAFKAVTGESWPQGRSVKVHGDGRAEFTKDRTTKSVLGKYVAPIAAGALTAGFAIPALVGGGAAAGGAGGAGAAGATGAGATGLGAVTGGGTSGLLASSGIPLAYAPGAAAVNAGALGGSIAAGGAGAGVTGAIARAAGKSVLGRIADEAAGPVAAGINQATQDAAANRGTNLTYAQEQERLQQRAQDDFQRQLIAREVENRAGNKAAMDRMQSASYNLQRKAYVPPTITSNVAGVRPQTVTDFGIGRTNAPTADEIAGYTADLNQSRDRLMSGSQLPPLTDPTQSTFYTQPNPNLKPGTMEKIGRIAGPALSIWDKISKYL